MNHQICGSCRCKAPGCGRVIAGPVAHLIGQGDQGQLVRYCQKLAEHVERDHPEIDRGLQLRALEFLGMLRLLNYDVTGDPGLMTQRDFLRWQIHRITRTVSINDDNIREKIAEVSEQLAQRITTWIDKAETPSAVEINTIAGEIMRTWLPIILGLRDEYEETGKYHIEGETPAPGSETSPASVN